MQNQKYLSVGFSPECSVSGDFFTLFKENWLTDCVSCWGGFSIDNERKTSSTLKCSNIKIQFSNEKYLKFTSMIIACNSLANLFVVSDGFIFAVVDRTFDIVCWFLDWKACDVIVDVGVVLSLGIADLYSNKMKWNFCINWTTILFHILK